MMRVLACGAFLAAFLGGCSVDYNHPPASAATYDPWLKYPLGQEYACADSHPMDERVNPLNAPSPGFGCAHQSNITAMVVNKADLHRPRPLGPADKVARARVLQAYRAGENTAVQVEAQGTQGLITTGQ